MHVAIVTDTWDPGGGGRERYLAQLAGYLRGRGWTIRVFCQRRGGQPDADAPQVHAFGGPAAVADVRCRTALARFRAAHATHAVLAARPMPGATHYQPHSGVYARAFEGERTAFDAAWRQRLFYPAMMLNVRRSRLLRLEAGMFRTHARPRLMAFSNAVRDDLARLFNVAASEVVVARPGIDLRVFRYRPRETGSAVRPLRLLFAGHNFTLKGLSPLLAALRRTLELGVDARLTVAGRGPQPRFARRARALGIAEHVHFAGAVSQDGLAELYRSSDALVHPAFYDPFPRTLLEALACGLPVITTRACGVAEIIEHGRQGLLLDDARAVEALAAAIATLADRGRRTSIADEAAQLGRTFDFEAHAGEVARWLAGQAG